MGKSKERTNVHQDATPETLTGGLGVTLETLTGGLGVTLETLTVILSCVKRPDLLTTRRIWAMT